MRYPEHVIEQVREQSDIVGVISEYTELTKKGHNHVGLCPFHNEKTPSFSVSDDKQMYYCFGCGAGGNIFTFLMERDNMTFPEAVQFLAERAHITIEESYHDNGHNDEKQKIKLYLELYTEAAKYYYYMLNDDAYKHSLEYFHERGISKETIKQFGLGYAPSEYNGLYKYLRQKGYEEDVLVHCGLCVKSEKKGVIYDRFSDRVMFPIFNLNKKVVAFGGRILNDGQPKYLNSAESILFDKSRLLYGLHIAKLQKYPYFILVEGYMDVIAMHQAGFSQTVASLGTAFTQGHAKLIKRYTNQLVILYDSDEAGKKATLRAIPILRAENIHVKVLQLKEAKDPDEFLKKHGKEEMQQLLDSAQSDMWFKIVDLENQYQLDLAEQKVEFLQEVSKIIANLDSTIEQSIYIEKIANHYSIDQKALESEIKKYFGMAKTIAPKTNVKKREPSVVGPTNKQLVFLSAIYHYSYVYEAIKEYVTAELFDEGVLQALATHVLEALEQKKAVDIQYFNNYFGEVDEHKAISTVFMNRDERYEDRDTLKKMLNETIKTLNLQYVESKLKQTKTISEVQNLLERKKVLDKLYIECING
ncbi:MAG: DNA primase [Cellulosilyticaceae bacterium]